MTQQTYDQSTFPATLEASPDSKGADDKRAKKLFVVSEAPGGKARKALKSTKRDPRRVSQGVSGAPLGHSDRAGLGCPQCGAGEPPRSSVSIRTAGSEGRARAGGNKEKRAPIGATDPRQVAFDFQAGNGLGGGQE